MSLATFWKSFLERHRIKDVSMDQATQMVRDAWYAQIKPSSGATDAPSMGPYVRDVYDDYIIVQEGSDLQKVPWTEDINGVIQFSDPVEVEMQYVAKAANEKAVWSTAMVNDLPDAAFLFVESGGEKDSDGKTTPRSLRHFPYKDAAGKVDLPHLRNAIARAPQAKLPQAVIDKVQARARNILNAQTSKKDIPLTFTKQTDGRLRFLGVVSNNYRDVDDPPEILSADAHKAAVADFYSGEQPWPILCLWHEKALRLGQGDMAEFVEPEGFVVVSGLVDEDKESWVKGLEDYPEPLGMSHEFEPLDRDEDNWVTNRYKQTEWTVLPQKWAANPLTGFAVARKENEVPITGDKRAFLESVIGSEGLTAFEGSLKDMAQAADGLEHKDQGDPEDKAVTQAGLKTMIASMAENMGVTVSADDMTGMMDDLSGMMDGTASDMMKAVATKLRALKKPSKDADGDEGGNGDDANALLNQTTELVTATQQRLDAQDETIKELAEAVTGLATALKDRLDALPETITAAVKERIGSVPRADVYRASHDPANAVDEAKKAVGSASGNQANTTDSEFWTKMQRRAIGHRAGGSGQLGG